MPATRSPLTPRMPDHPPEMHRRNGERRGRRLVSISVLPTLCTLGNLVAGFAAMFYAAKPASPPYVGPWGWSALTMAGSLLFVGMFLDAIDGSVARLTRSVSELGTQLDSLADMITFGAAPAFMALMLVRPYLAASGNDVLGPEADNILGKLIWGSAAVYVCCAALRLARYNVETGSGVVNERGTFSGLPSPGAAGVIVSLVLLHQHLILAPRYVGGVSPGFTKAAALGIPFVMLLCGLAMVSSIPWIHFANRFVHGAKSFGYMARIVVVIFLAIWWFQETLALVFTIYLFSGPIAMLRRRMKRAPEEAVPE